MAKRDIERALKRKGVRIEQLYWKWQPTPEEMVPCWTLEINEEDSDRYGLDVYHFFDNTKYALEEIENWEILE